MKAVLAVLVACGALVIACGGSSGGGGGDSAAIKNRLNSLVNHFNKGDAKGILDDDVPASARRTCSDKDAKELLSQGDKFGAKLGVKSVEDIAVSGTKATASVVFSTGVALLPQLPPVTVPFVKDGGTWHIDVSDQNGCNGIIPTGLR